MSQDKNQSVMEKHPGFTLLTIFAIAILFAIWMNSTRPPRSGSPFVAASASSTPSTPARR